MIVTINALNIYILSHNCKALVNFIKIVKKKFATYRQAIFKRRYLKKVHLETDIHDISLPPNTTVRLSDK